MGVVYYVMSGRGKDRYRFKGPMTKQDAEACLADSRKSDEEFEKRTGRKSEYSKDIEAVEASDELVSILDRASAHRATDYTIGVHQSQPAEETGGCVGCGSPRIGHKTGRGNWCCRCYVLTGNPPADWHWGCMETYHEMQAVSAGNPES